MERNYLGILGIAIALGCILIGYSMWSHMQQPPSLLTIAFLDVGQGDAIFIETPTGNQVLIDGGVDSSVLSELGRVMNPGDHRIDMVIATHPDADHIGGLIDVIERYAIDMYVESGAAATTELFATLNDTVEANVPESITASIGDRIVSEDGVVLDILAPYGIDDTDDTNARSIVVRLTYGTMSVLLTGDAPVSVEQDLVRWYGTQLESEILKAGHHGSKTSTSPSFIASLDPMIGIISAGKDNRYGHPHPQVVDTLETANVQILGTYDAGTIVFESDGVNIWRK